MFNRRDFLKSTGSLFAGTALVSKAITQHFSAVNPKVLLEHRSLLSEFADKYNDSLAKELLPDNVKARLFPTASEDDIKRTKRANLRKVKT